MVAEAENKAPELRKYDPNRALLLSGLRELTPVQSEAFEKWWRLFFNFLIEDYPSKTDLVFWIVIHSKDSNSGFKRLFEESTTTP